MSKVGRNLVPHSSHEMGAWEPTIVSVSGGVERFGSARSCINCGGMQVACVSGEEMEDELVSRCSETEMPAYYKAEQLPEVLGRTSTQILDTNNVPVMLIFEPDLVPGILRFLNERADREPNGKV